MAQGGLQLVAYKLPSSRAGSFILVVDADDTVVNHRLNLRPKVMFKFFLHIRSGNNFAVSVAK